MGAEQSASVCDSLCFFDSCNMHDPERVRKQTKGTKSYAHYLKTHHETLAVYPPSVTHWVSAPDCKKEIVASKEGVSSTFTHDPITIPALFQKVATKCASRTALAVERRVPAHAASLPEDQWTKWSYNDYFHDTLCAAKGLMDLGVTHFSSVCIYAWNAPEWSITHLATNFLGAKAVGIYPNDSPQTAAKKLHHSAARTLVVDDQTKAGSLRDVLHLMPELRTVVYWGDNVMGASNELHRAVGRDVKVISWAQLINGGKNISGTQLQERMDAVEPGHAAALIYAEGDHNWSDKPPVMLSHDNLLFSVASFLETYVGLRDHQDERILSFLPPAHISSLLTDVFAPLMCTLQKANHTCIVYFARQRDLQDGPLIDRARTVKPTVFFAFVDIWDAMADQIMKKMRQESVIKSHVVSWAVNEKLRSEGKMMNKYGGWEQSTAFSLAYYCVLKDARKFLGLSDVRFAWTTTGSIKNSTMDFFGALGLHINELYGTAESTGPVTTSTAETACLWNGAGMQFPGCEVKLFRNNGLSRTECGQVTDVTQPRSGEVGEIYIRGRHVMMGHYANPSFGVGHVTAVDRLNRATIMGDGFMRTAHLGIHHGGLIYVTANIKGDTMLSTSTHCVSSPREGLQPSDFGTSWTKCERTVFSPTSNGDASTVMNSPQSHSSGNRAVRKQHLENLLHAPTLARVHSDQRGNPVQGPHAPASVLPDSSRMEEEKHDDIRSMEVAPAPKSEPPRSLQSPTVFGSAEFQQWLSKLMAPETEPLGSGISGGAHRRRTSGDQHVMADGPSPSRVSSVSPQHAVSVQRAMASPQRKVALPLTPGKEGLATAKVEHRADVDHEGGGHHSSAPFVLEN